MGKLGISVIIPVYNKRLFLKACFQSVLSQMNKEDEIILIDDGSNDGSKEVCLQFVNDYQNVKLINQEHKGVSCARNNGIRYAKGQYCLFIDCDDTVEEGLLDECRQIMHNNMLMVFGMSFDYYLRREMSRQEVYAYPEETRMNQKQVMDNLHELFAANSLSSACNKAFNLELIKENQLKFNEHMYLYEDLDFVLKYLSCLNEKEYIQLIKHPYYHYRLSAVQSNLHNRVADISKLHDNLFELQKTMDRLGDITGYKEKTDQLYAEIYSDLMYTHLIHTDTTEESVHTLVLNVEKTQNLDKTLMNAQLDGVRKVVADSAVNKDENGLEKYIHQRKRRNALRKTIKKVLGKG